MSYRINYTDTVNNPTGIVVEDQSLNNTDTDLIFVGKNYPGYAQFVGENFLHLLENFASNTAPDKPTVGQLWYDIGTLVFPAKPQLKIFDGTNWTEASSIKKNTVRPAAENSITGDLWVDTTNQQLYLFTGASWTLVGPQFNEINGTGFKSEEIIDRNNTTRIVLTILAEEERIAIFSKEEFIPKSTVDGFPVISQGITLSKTSTKKYWGTSEKADALVVGNATIAAGNFLRGDVVSTTNFALNVRNLNGINIGQSLETSITATDVGTIVSQKTPGRSVVIQATETSGTTNDVLVITGNKRVGVNKIPTEVLDVNGNVLVNGTIKTTSTSSTSIETVGGASISGNLIVAGSNVTIVGEIEIGPVSGSKSILYPTSNKLLDLGKDTKRFRTVYAETINAEVFTGSVQGNVTGSASSANILSTPRAFSLIGDVTSTSPILFNGSDNATINTTIGDAFFTSKAVATVSPLNDFLFLYNALPSDNLPTIRKISKANFLNGVGTVPVGAIVPYAGNVAPIGYLMCDGSEQSRSVFNALFNVIGFNYKPSTLLAGSNSFALPDLRGRFPLGKENMDNNNNISIETRATGVSRQQVFPGAINATFIVSDSNTVNGPFQVGKTIEGTGLDSSLSSVFVIASVTNNTPSAGLTTVVVSCAAQPGIAVASNLTLSSIGTLDAGGSSPSPSRVPDATVLGRVGGQRMQTAQYQATGTGTSPIPGSFGAIPFEVMNPYLTINYIIYAGV